MIQEYLNYLQEGWWSGKKSKDMIGDIPCDEMGKSLDTIIKEYREYVGRPPRYSELRETFEYVVRPMKRELSR